MPLAMTDSLGILGKPEEKKPKPPRFAMTDSLGILSEITPEAPKQAQAESIPLQAAHAPETPMMPAHGQPETSGEPQFIEGVSSKPAFDRWMNTGGDSLIARHLKEQYIQAGKRAVIQVKTGITPKEQVEREAPEVLEQPWFDPTMAASGGAGAGTKAALSAGAKFLPAITKGLASAFSAAATDLPISQIAEGVEGPNQEHPYLAMATAIATGIVSGMTVERAIENQIMKAFGKATGGKLAPEVINRVKTAIAEEGPSSPWSEAISDRMTRRRAEAAVKTAPEPQPRSGGEVLESVEGTPQEGVRPSVATEATPTPDMGPTAFQQLRGELYGKPGRRIEGGEGYKIKPGTFDRSTFTFDDETIKTDLRGVATEAVEQEGGFRGSYIDEMGQRQWYGQKSNKPGFMVSKYAAREVKQAIDKAIAGEPVGRRQKAIVQDALDYLQEQRRTYEGMGTPKTEDDFDWATGQWKTGLSKEAAQLEASALGAGAGVEIEQDADGTYKVRVNPEKALAGMALTYGGRKALGADTKLFNKAQSLFDAGKKRFEVWRETGWMKGKEGKWRFEIDDSGAKVSIDALDLDNAYRLSDVIDHPKLFKAYPKLADIEVYPYAKSGSTQASYHDGIIDLGVNQSGKPEIKTLLHEVQHAIQDIEGFARGGSPTAFQSRVKDIDARLSFLAKEMDRIGETDPEFKAAQKEFHDLMSEKLSIGPEGYLSYKKLAGEVEARDVSARRALTAADRREMEPYISQGIPEDQWIVRDGKGTSFSVEEKPKTAEAPKGKATDTPEFKSWFGKSKVVDEKGKPLVVYHGTTKDFDAFKESRHGIHFATTAKQASARAYGEGSNIIPSYLKIDNLRRSKDTGDTWASRIESAKKAGYDGIVYLNRFEGMTPENASKVVRLRQSGVNVDAMSDFKFLKEFPDAKDSYIVFSPTQIKSSMGNRGTFDPTDPNILRLHPSTITGPMGGLAYGIEQDENGNYQINLRKALIGSMAGAAGPVGLKRLSRLGELYTSKVGQPVVDFIKDRTNKLITNESIRFWAGMGKDQEFGDVVRNFRRETENIWNHAKEIGLKLQELAPTAAEQKRIMQVIKGGVTMNAQTQFRARQIQEEFSKLREELKQANLLEYSRYDKLTRAERAELRDLISGPDPATLKGTDLAAYAQKVGADIPKKATDDEVRQAIQTKLDFHKSRLDDYYHVASAEEYAPVMYDRHEGLSPKQKDVIRDEIQNLKKQSRDGAPQGREAVEGLILELEGLLKSGKAGKAFKTKIQGGYAHRRKDIPIETQRLMGMIEEAPYPVAKGLGTQHADVAKAKLFKGIAGNPEWARSAQDQKLRFGVPSNFQKVEGKEFGALDNMFVRKDVVDDLKDVFEWRNSFVRNWDKLLGYWKGGKVVLNPATHARNFMSNLILSYFGDVSPTDIATYTKAGKAMVQKESNRYFKEAADWGLFNNTFYSAEINKLRDGIAKVRDPGQLKGWIRTAMSAPGELYQGQEQFFKMAVFIKARESGMTVDEAARKAEHHLFNYSDIPPWVKHMKRWVAPFFTFTYKAVPLVAETSITKPWKVAAIGAAMYGMEKYAADKLGMTPEEATAQRESLAPWQQRRVPPVVGPYTQVLMPFQDDWGNNLYLDMAYILPYGNLGEEWGQSNLPLSDLMPSLPWAKTLTAVMTNRDPFTGKDIYNKVLDSSGRILEKQLEYVWRDLSPSNPLVPGSHSFNKLWTGIKNYFGEEGDQIQDWAGRPMSIQNAILSSFLGIKLSPANQDKLDQFKAMEQKTLVNEFMKERKRIERQRSQKRITEDEYQTELGELDDVLKRIQGE